MANRTHFNNLFVSENLSDECDLVILVRKHSHIYVDEQNRRSVPLEWFVAGMGY